MGSWTKWLHSWGWRFHTSSAACTCTHHSRVPILPARDRHRVPDMALFPRMISHLLVAACLQQTTSIVEEAAFCSLHMDLPSRHAMLLPKLPHRMFYPLSWYSTQHCCRPRNSAENEVQQWAHAHGIHRSYHVPPHSEAVGLIKWWNGLLKTELQYQFGGNTLHGWDKVLQKPVYTLNQHAIYDAVIRIDRIH